MVAMKPELRTITHLRTKLGAAEGRQVELNAEILEVSYGAHTGVAKDRKRLTEINHELARLAPKRHAASPRQWPRLRAGKRRREMPKSPARRRADMEQADKIMLEAETLAATMDAAMSSLKAAAVDLQDKMATIRRLSGAGPQHTAIRVHLARAPSSGLMGLPQHPDLLAPNERHSVAELTTAWAAQVRNVIATA